MAEQVSLPAVSAPLGRPDAPADRHIGTGHADAPRTLTAPRDGS